MDRMDQTYIMEYIEGIVSLYYVRRDYVSKLVSERISLEISANNGKLDPKVEHIVTIIGSLPDRFNNKMQGKTSDALLPEYPNLKVRKRQRNSTEFTVGDL